MDELKLLRNRRLKRILLLIADILLIAVMTVSLIVKDRMASSLDSQKAAQYWQGDGKEQYRQISCFIPESEKITREQVYKFRDSAKNAIHTAALDITSESTLFVDAWSANGKLTVFSEKAHGDASVIAVGGEYFSFHPLQLINGSYFSERDMSTDIVLLDEQMAWLLFGGMDIQGMSLTINGQPFVVGGVISRETDTASAKAYTAGQGIYMSYDAYTEINGEESGVSCYEAVLPEPVKGFAKGVFKDSFPIGGGIIVENTSRYSFSSLWNDVKDFGSRSMQTAGVIYPYWENAARYVEDWCALLLLIAIICSVLPILTVVVVVTKLLIRAKNGLGTKVLPKLKDNAEEAIRVRQRKAWEKRHNGAH